MSGQRDADGFRLQELVDPGAAGVGQGLIVLALPVVLPRYSATWALRSHAALIGVVCGLVFLRTAHHLHCEVSALALVPWAVTSALVYLWFSQLWPLVIAHAAYNVSLVLTDHGWPRNRRPWASHTCMRTACLRSARSCRVRLDHSHMGDRSRPGRRPCVRLP
ncbi:MAG: hypothetical protein GX616_08005 [Planctomycetes bacterium]|nr:hypothetical protein [Planctomycetota bacterium]